MAVLCVGCLGAIAGPPAPLTAKLELPYRAVEGWGQLPADYEPGAGMAVAIDSRGGIWYYNRGSHPVIHFSGDGSLIQAWKEDKAVSLHQVAAHGMSVGPDGGVWLVDREANTLYKYSPAGRALLTLGSFAGRHGDNETRYAFNRPAGVAHDRAGQIYVADGYRNARVVKYSSAGDYVTHWGGPGSEDGQFNLVHGVALDGQDRVYVADRGNKRVQVFDPDGKHLATWTGLGTPWNLAFDSAANALWMCDGDAGRITKLSLAGDPLGWFGAGGSEPGQLHQVHSIAVDSAGAVYAAETVNQRIQKFVPAG